MASKLSHYDSAGKARMVDVGNKKQTRRTATASAFVELSAAVLAALPSNPKGDPLEVARIAGIQGAKRTSELIPMCHPLNITSVAMEFFPKEEKSCVEVQATVRLVGKTGVEMEALVAVSTAALTIYDMCKAIDREMTITDVQLLKKSGGKSGAFVRERQ